MASKTRSGPGQVNDVRWRRAVHRKLLGWYDLNKRDLPWRRVRDPYAIWVSETMLQQTRVETVIPYWERFLERFPDVETLADAPQSSVYEAWTGLGYYSRARNLQAAARQIVENHAGQLPATAPTLETLKGIGPYTAGAVASIAFDQPAAIVDGNVVRVLSRLCGIREDVGRKPVVDRFWQISAELVASGSRPGDFNQAMMELGATTCLPRSPLCGTCPVHSHCDAANRGDAEALPIKKKRAAPKHVVAVGVWIERRGRVLALQRPETGLMANLWELPGGDVDIAAPNVDDTAQRVQSTTGLEISNLERVGEIEHLFTHRRMTLHVHRAGTVSGRIRLEGPQAFRWVPGRALAGLPQAGPMRKALALLGVDTGISPRERLRGERAEDNRAR